MNNFVRTHKKIIYQIAILIIIASLFTLTRGKLSFFSAILGGLCWIMPSIYFKLRMQKIMTSFDIQKMLKMFLISQALKLISSFGMIILVLLLITVDKRSFLVSYAAMIFTSFPMLMTKMNPNKMKFFRKRAR